MLKVKDVIRLSEKLNRDRSLAVVLSTVSCPTNVCPDLEHASVMTDKGKYSNFYFSSYHGLPEVVNEKINIPISSWWRMLSFTIGSDPEVFVGKEGKVIPAWKFLRCKAEVGNAYNTPYWDGFQAEFTLQPQNCCEYLTDNFRKGLLELRKHGDIILDSVIDVPKATLTRAAASHVELGCNPSMNAYNAIGAPVVNGRELDVRFAGMHMHFGYGGRKFDAVKMVKALDKVLGVTLTAIGSGKDNPIRRMYYGLAGEYRLPKHGLEYRVPGSWVMTHPALIHLSFDLARWTLGLEEFGQLDDNWEADEAEVQQIINQGDFVAARKVLERPVNTKHLDAFRDRLYASYGKEQVQHTTFWNILNGIIQFDPNKFDKYWRVGGEWLELCHSTNCNFGSFVSTGGNA